MMDARDWFVLFHVNAAGFASTAYLFLHPDTTTFTIWVGFVGTIIAFYQWQAIRDRKLPDAPKS